MNYQIHQPSYSLFNRPPALLLPLDGRILEIIRPEGNNPRVRDIVSRSQTRPTGKYPSWKMRRVLEWESHNELFAFRLLDANPKVIGFYEQPLAIYYQLNGEFHWHVPDILVVTDEDKELWEVKPEKFAASTRIGQRTAFLSWALRREGYSYRLAISDELGRQPRLLNASALLRHGRKPVSPQVREQLRRCFMNEPRITWGDLTIRDELFIRVICRLILEGQIGIDMDKAISPNALLWWNSSSDLKGGI